MKTKGSLKKLVSKGLALAAFGMMMNSETVLAQNYNATGIKMMNTSTLYDYTKYLNNDGVYVGGLIFNKTSPNYGPANSFGVYAGAYPLALTSNTSNIILNPNQTHGKVGIGTYDPESRLHVHGSGTQTIRVTTDGLTAGFHAKNDLGYITFGRSGKLLKVNNTGSFSDNHFVVDGGGNIGVGTSAPDEKFHIVNSRAAAVIESNGANNWAFLRLKGSQTPAYDIALNNNGNGDLEFRPNGSNSNRMILTQSGDLSVDGAVNVAGNLRANAMREGTADADGMVQIKHPTSGDMIINAATNEDIRFTNGNDWADRLVIRGDGDVEISGNTYPRTAGAAGQVLGTDGVGNLAWQNNPEYFSNPKTNVIETNSSRTVRVKNPSYDGDLSSLGFDIEIDYTSGGWFRQYSISRGVNPMLAMGVKGVGLNTQYGYLGTDANNVFMAFDNDGRIGVGTTDPGKKFHLYEDAGDGGTAFMVDAEVNTNPNIMFGIEGAPAGNIRINDQENDQLQFQVGPNLDVAMSLEKNGIVHIPGRLLASGNLYPNTTGSAGQVLGSDGSGTITWVDKTPDFDGVLEGHLHVSEGANIQRDLLVGQNLMIGQDLMLGGNIEFGGQILGPLNVSENAIINRDLEVLEGANINGELIASGNVYPTNAGTDGQVLGTDGTGALAWVNQTPAFDGTLNGTLEAQAAIIHGELLAGGNLYPMTSGNNGQVLGTNGSGTLEWIDPSTFDGNLNGNLNVTGTAEVNGETTLNGGVNVLDKFTIRTIGGSLGSITTGEGTIALNVPGGQLEVRYDNTFVGGGNRYPNTKGMYGQVLATDGAGNLFWQDASSGSGGAGLPDVTGQGGKYLSVTDVGQVLWQDIPKFWEAGNNSMSAVVSEVLMPGHLSIGGASTESNVGNDLTVEYDLFVKKKILAGGLKVAVDGEDDWADYVFADDYQLKSLEEVSDFVEENDHLPGVPSAKQVAENGIDVAKMDAKLMEKIEELTLYLIEMNEKIKEQDKIIEELRK